MVLLFLNLVTSVKFLGVNLDRGLRWDAHTDQLSQKLIKNIYILCNLGECMTGTVLRQVYFSLCHSHISYAIIAWGHAARAGRVFRLQRRAVRMIAGLGYGDYCREAFRQNRILTLPCIFILETLCYMHTNIGAYITHDSIHDYNTRNKQNIALNCWRLKPCQDGLTKC